ncbi:MULTISPECIES: CCRG-2 family RiPP [Prochlorococcus]|uniref:CCRG-2 family RiPP n=2 Tax=Prochlorococcus TaxID=1218 RepID=UPI000B0F0E4C|nr:CCRG-2 family RiPP [Prochlorococcus marinus]
MGTTPPIHYQIKSMNNTELSLNQLKAITGGAWIGENGEGCISPSLAEFLKKLGWDPSKPVKPIMKAF